MEPTDAILEGFCGDELRNGVSGLVVEFTDNIISSAKDTVAAVVGEIPEVVIIRS